MEKNPSSDRRRRADPDNIASNDDVPVFVYGTLRRGMPMASLLHDCRWEGVARVEGSLYDLGEFPAMALEPAGTVEGELWLCCPETLPVLDAYEGVGEGLFERVKIPADAGWCWTYIAGPALRGRLTQARRVASGRWEA